FARRTLEDSCEHREFSDVARDRALGSMARVIGYQIMATHQVAHAVDRGFGQATVVWLFAFGAGCMMAGNLLGGWLSDQFGRGSVFALGSIVAIVGIGCLGLLRSPDDWPLLLLYTASGFGFGMRIAQLSAIPADTFSGPHLGAILGVVQAGGGLGGAIGAFLGGWLFDVTGNYRLAFAAAAIAVAGSAVAAWVAAPRKAQETSGAISRLGVLRASLSYVSSPKGRKSCTSHGRSSRDS
ncbi:MAG: hypothetical protein DME11_24095, partial [Candidatus Rokuibacteriota bacterium]